MEENYANALREDNGRPLAARAALAEEWKSVAALALRYICCYVVFEICCTAIDTVCEIIYNISKNMRQK